MSSDDGSTQQSVVKGAWSAEEDALLLKAIEANGARKWSVLASHLPGRTGKQCRERWHNQLNPDVSKSPWTEDEDRASPASPPGPAPDPNARAPPRDPAQASSSASTPSSARGGRTSRRCSAGARTTR